MDRALLTALVVTLALAVPAGAGPAAPGSPTAPQVDDNGTADVEMLGLAGDTRSDAATQGLDVSAALVADRAGTEAALDRRALQITFERTSGDQARRELLFQAATDVEIAISELGAERRSVRAGYLNGTTDTERYIRFRASSGARTQQLRTDLETIETLAGSVSGLSMRSRVDSLQVALTGSNGPVTDRLRASIHGTAEPATVYTSVSSDGRVLSTVAGDQYVREAYRTDLWTPDTTGNIGIDQAAERMAELYPVAFGFNSSRNQGRGIATHGAGTYEITIQINEGTIVTYLDADTGNVFHEVQRFDLAAIDPPAPVVAADNGTRLVVNRTHEGGPLRVATYDNATDATVDAPVRIGNIWYRTGGDGVVWAPAPAGPTRVTAVGESGNVSVTMNPSRPTLVAVGSAEG